MSKNLTLLYEEDEEVLDDLPKKERIKHKPKFEDTPKKDKNALQEHHD